MSKVMFNVHWPEGHPTVGQICQKYGLSPQDLDDQFGVIEVDPAEHVYTILVDESAAARLEPDRADRGLEGPFSNPKIEPFGPPEA